MTFSSTASHSAGLAGRAAGVRPARPGSAGLLGHHLALGGGAGLAHWLVSLFIWHEIWRLARFLWHIPRFGPVIVILLVVAVVALSVLTSRRRRGGSLSRRGVRRGGSIGRGTGGGPRDW